MSRYPQVTESPFRLPLDREDQIRKPSSRPEAQIGRLRGAGRNSPHRPWPSAAMPPLREGWPLRARRSGHRETGAWAGKGAAAPSGDLIMPDTPTPVTIGQSVPSGRLVTMETPAHASLPRPADARNKSRHDDGARVRIARSVQTGAAERGVRASGASAIGQWSTAAATPSPTAVSQTASYEPVRSNT